MWPKSKKSKNNYRWNVATEVEKNHQQSPVNLRFFKVSSVIMELNWILVYTNVTGHAEERYPT